MTVTENSENGKVVLKVEGWLDNKSAPELGTVIDGITEAKELVLDFDGLEYMSSAGVRQVVSAHRTAGTLNASFSVINVSTDVMSIFEMTGLNRKLSIQAKSSVITSGT